MQLRDKTYYPYFDYLRIVLASVVMFGHSGLISWSHSGSLAVSVFFALSGWLIGGMLLKTDRPELPRFFFNRAIRIWIPYYIAVFLIVCASVIKDPIDQQWIEIVFYKLSWVYNIFGIDQLISCTSCMPLDGTANHFWSINAEEQFYLLAPLLLVVFAEKGRRILTWLLIAATLWYMDIYAPIAFGVLAAVINSKFPDFYTSVKCRSFMLAALLATIPALAIDDYYNITAPIFSICLVLLLAIKGKSNSVGVFLGGISYPLYLNHWIGVFSANFALEPFGLRGSDFGHILAILINYGLAAFLYWFIERKALSLREKLYSISVGYIFSCLAYSTIILGLTFGLVLNPSYPIAAAWLLFVTTGATVIISILKSAPFKQPTVASAVQLTNRQS